MIPNIQHTVGSGCHLTLTPSANDLDHPSSTDQTRPEQWVQTHADVLYRYALSRVGQSHLAEDLVQETLVAAMHSRRSFRGDSTERTWLIGILRHKLLDHFRAGRSRVSARFHEHDDGEDGLETLFDAKGNWKQPPQSWAPDASQGLENREFWAVFHNCMTALPLRARKAFTMKVLDDLASEDICKELNITTTNLWVVLHRARALLRVCLEKHWFSPADRQTPPS